MPSFDRRVPLLAALVATSVALPACNQPPEKELRQAQEAIQSARAAGAVTYAEKELAGAERMLDEARSAVDQRDYRLALNQAVDSREQALSAATEATSRQNTLRTDSERTVAAAVTELAAAQKRLKAIDATGRNQSRRASEVARIAERVQEARAALKNGEFANATKLASEANVELAGLRQVEKNNAPTARQRR